MHALLSVNSDSTKRIFKMSNNLTRQDENLTNFSNCLLEMRGELSKVLPEKIPVDRFIRTVITTVNMTPDLLNVDRKSLIMSCMKAAQDGLLCDGREAALVVYYCKDGKKAQYMPMVGGLRKKVLETGKAVHMLEAIVYENDFFEYELGDNERIIHRPTLKKEKGEILAAYAIVQVKHNDGIASYREVMTFDEIEKIRNCSKCKDSGPWEDWYTEKAKVAVFKRLYKRLPSSESLDKIIEHDNEEYQSFEQRPVFDEKTKQAIPGSSSRLKAIVNSSVEEVQEDPEARKAIDDFLRMRQNVIDFIALKPGALKDDIKIHSWLSELDPATISHKRVLEIKDRLAVTYAKIEQIVAPKNKIVEEFFND